MKLIVIIFTSFLSMMEKLLSYNNTDSSYKHRRDFVIKKKY